MLAVVLAVCGVAWPSSTDWYAAAAAARASWRYDRALDFYQQAIQADPDNPRPVCLKGEVLALQQRAAEAAAAYLRCRRLGDDGAQVWLALGDLARQQGDPAAAEHAWLSAAARGSATAHRRLALLYEAQSQFVAAANEWQRLGAGDGQAQEHLGMLALRAVDGAEAQRHFLAAQALPGPYGGEVVATGLSQLAATVSTSAASEIAVGIAFIRAQAPGFARLPLQNALAQAPNDGPAHAYLAWVEWEAGEHDASQAEMVTARALDPLDAFTLFVASVQDVAAGAWSQASDDVAQALQVDGENPALWLVRAQVALGTQDYLSAELSYETAARLAPEPQFTEQLLQFYIDHRLGLAHGRAYDAGVTALARWPDDGTIAALVGQLDELADQPTAAYLADVRANHLDPSNPEPYMALGRFAVRGRQYDTAVTDLRTAIALQPDGPWAAPARALLAPLSFLDL
jgi:tetratricopeptide (TPR) repeat protein